MRLKYLFIILIGCTVCELPGQERGAGLNYHRTLISNPGMTGTAGDGVLRLSYLNLYPGNNFGLHMPSFSYDSYFDGLHGGAAVWLTDELLGGIINDINAGFSYAYHFRAGENVFISAGLSASVCYRGYNFNDAILPNQIDPISGVINPPGETLAAEPGTGLDIGTGFVIMTGELFAGLSVSHLTEPVPGHLKGQGTKIPRNVLIHGGYRFILNENEELSFTPVAKVELSEYFSAVALGSSFEVNKLTLSAIFIGDTEKNLDLQAGFSLNYGMVVFNYNYRINIVSPDAMLPLSVMHQAGVAVRLKIVNKRNSIKTINFPKL